MRCLVPLAILGLAALGEMPAYAAGPSKLECIAANDAGQDLRRAGKLTQAREKLLLCASQGCPGAVREDCTQRLDEIDRVMPTVVFEVKDGSGNDVTAVRVSMDGQPLAQTLGATAIPVDPGEHRFTFEDRTGTAPKVEESILIREGDKDRRVHVALGAVQKPQAKEQTPHDASTSGDGSSQRTIALVLGGAGVVSLVVGGVFALVAKSSYDGASGCPSACTDSGYSQGQSAYNQATVATVGLIAGGALVAAGGVLLVTAPKAGGVTISPSVGSSGVGLHLTGGW